MSPYGVSLSHSLLGAAALLIAAALTRTAWTRRGRPGAGALATVGGLLTLGSLVFLGMFVYPARYQRLWIVTLYNTSGFGAVFAFLFAIRFTGRGQWLTRSVRTLLISLPVILLLVSFVPFELGVETTSQAGLLTQRVIGLVSGLLTPLYAIAAAILLWAAIARDAVPYGQGLLPAGSLLLLALAPGLSSVFAYSERIFPVVLILAGGGLLATLRWYRPLEQLPVARPVVQSRIVDELSEPVVAIDRKDRVVDLNTAAEDTFDCEQSTVVGRPARRVLTDAVLAHEERHLIEVSDGVRTVIPEAVGDADGAPLGTVLLFGDATDQRLRERQTRMLTDLLSEVIGVQLDEIARLASSVENRDGRDAPGVAESDAPADPEGVGERIRTRSDLLLAVGKRAREMERALAETSFEASSDLLTGVRTAATRSSIQADEHTVHATGESYTVTVPQPLLIAGFAAVFDAVTIRHRSVTVSVEADIGGRGTNGGSVVGADSRTGSDTGGSNRRPGPRRTVVGADDHGYDGVVYVDIRTDSRSENADPVSEPTAEHPAAKLLSLIAIDAGGSVAVDGTPWEHLRVALPARKIRFEGER
ncbi:histidine kinase N-terminal 7TM domain-containing protein [Candidatus Halobonum tyrrellensis]|uniref:PAS/PAC sensor protein n=1 Tax=Candidatus Halobonum tyrrellensis G22 TaxID=1324957 RepID=V4HG61_9EURY|nr:histidine kinase N-terminal 7TM domain-containing protein [Candidatus Halobonum tyrrellensis]ESP89705.1 PAS/PAC sensor protein [Candidatus Halobonum tyrrellensis G22]